MVLPQRYDQLSQNIDFSSLIIPLSHVLFQAIVFGVSQTNPRYYTILKNPDPVYWWPTELVPKSVELISIWKVVTHLDLLKLP